jgi:hypothetical protein
MAGWLSSRGLGAEATVAEPPPVMLPAFVVNEDREQPKWRYIGHRDFEVLTLVSTGTAEEFAEQLSRTIEILDVLIPPAVRLRLPTPAGFIFDPQVAVPLGVDGGVATLATERGVKLNRPHTSYLLNYGRLDRDAFAFYVSVIGPTGITRSANAIVVGPSTQTVAARAVSAGLYPSLIAQSRPPPAAWLVEGVRTVVLMSHLDGRALRFGEFPGKRSPLMPFAEVARVLGRDPIARPVSAAEREAMRAASDTAVAFAKWALFADDGKHRPRFWDFYQRAARDPDAGEALFQSSFGKSSAEILPLVAAYRSKTDWGGLRVSFPKPKQAVSPEKIRDATPAEIARITGEWARLAAPTFPRYKDQLLARAGRILDRGLKDSPTRDPSLLAAVGIYRAEMGRDAEALPLLDEATKGGVVRPRAYLELARIRLAASWKALGAGEKLSAAEVGGAMELLQRANAQSDQQEHYYELLVSLWENAGNKPTRAELAPLAACAKIFTPRTDLTLRSAKLHAALGYTTEARALCETALPFAKDEKVRAGLMALSESRPR